MRSVFLPYFVLLAIVISSSSCKKKEIPVVETTSLSSITNSSAISGGSITSDGGSGVISRGVCWATNPKPLTEDNKTSDGTGTGSFSSTITNLDPGVEYYVRAYATNAEGTGYGTPISFKTLGQVPSAGISPASNITSNSASLSAEINPNYVSTTVTFEFGTSTSYGSSASAIESPVNGSSKVSVSANLAELTPGTIYHFRVKAENSLGVTYSPDLTFTTLGQAPTATIPVVSNLTTSSGTFSASANANYVSTIVSFEYGTTTDYGNSVPALQSPVQGNVSVPVSANITGLTPGTVYHIRLKTENTLGITYSSDLTITTLGQVPTALTGSISQITTNSARFSGIINAKYLTTAVSFEYGKTIGYGNSASALPNPVTGNTNVNVTANINGLEPGTLYHARITAINVLGTTNGIDVTFKTLGQIPSAVSLPASNVFANSAMVNGRVNANYLPTTVTFEYGTSTSYGSTASAAQSPLNGNIASLVSATLSGLTEGATYNFRIKAENALGVTYSENMTFVPGLINPLEVGLMGYYPLDGNAIDESGHNYDGIISGSELTSNRDNVANKAMLFSGNDSYISLGSNFDYPERTINIWFNASIVDLSERHIYISDNPSLLNGFTQIKVEEIGGIKQIRSSAGVPGGSAEGNARIMENTWYMITLVVDELNTRHYLNGNLIGTFGNGWQQSNNGDPMALLGTSRVFDRSFIGKIDDVRIYNRALSVEEINALLEY